ncbi:hypothetical protein [uncultured Xanthomonas sp.]|uniref:hypothetical protein n=1 Tax=uncultured Xanthomonas sp. TaxID=152831 RepID=UPI0025F60DC4|nr:hypothetical protein [uncultured Xanthomonas sp.]
MSIDADNLLRELGSELADRVAADEAALSVLLVDSALAKGWAVSVYDGEETTLRRSRDRAAIFAAMASTDADTLRFHDEAGAYLGWVWLIWGNGCDLFSDWTDNAAINAVVEPIAFSQ